MEIPVQERSYDEAEGQKAPREIIVVGVLAVMFGIAVRFTTRSALWLDEALTVNISSLPFSDMIDALRHDGHPPLYYAILHVWMEIFGSGDFAVRSLSGMFGVLALPLAWFVGRRRGGPLLAWLLVTVVALSPFAVRYSDEARMYSLVILLVLAGYLLVDDVVRRGKQSVLRLGGIAVISSALLYTHYWSIWLLGAIGLVLLWIVWRPQSPTQRRNALATALAIVVGGLLFVPWVPTMLYQAAHTGTPWAAATRPTTALGFTLSDFGAGLYSDSVLVGMLVAIAILLGVTGRAVSGRAIVLNLRTERQVRIEAVVAALTFIIGSGIAFVSNSAFATRYAAVVFPLVALLIAAGLSRFTARWVRLGVVLGFSAFLAVGGLWNVADNRTQAKQAADIISSEARPGDLVVYCPDQLGPSGNRALGDDLEQVVYPTFASPKLVDWVDYGARNAEADPAAFADRVLEHAGAERAIFVVWNPEYKTFEGQCEKLISKLGSGRPAVDLLVADGPGYFEHEYVTWFPVRSETAK